jgi:hypothetical protein
MHRADGPLGLTLASVVLQASCPVAVCTRRVDNGADVQDDGVDENMSLAVPLRRLWRLTAWPGLHGPAVDDPGGQATRQHALLPKRLDDRENRMHHCAETLSRGGPPLTGNVRCGSAIAHAGSTVPLASPKPKPSRRCLLLHAAAMLALS